MQVLCMPPCGIEKDVGGILQKAEVRLEFINQLTTD